jgi:tetratricopeptide (TPR) repeat protein
MLICKIIACSKKELAGRLYQRAKEHYCKDTPCENNLAIELLSQAIELDSINYKFYVERGYLLAKRGEHIKAIIDFSRSLELRPLDFNSHLFRGTSYEILGEKELAKKDYSAIGLT